MDTILKQEVLQKSLGTLDIIAWYFSLGSFVTFWLILPNFLKVFQNFQTGQDPQNVR